MPDPELTPKNQELSQEFRDRCQRLRGEINAICERETQERIQKNPNPTPGELLMGAFREQLEPPIRDAIIKINQKGYPTQTAGFVADGLSQYMSGVFDIDPNTEEKLSLLGVQVSRRPLRDRKDPQSVVTRFEFFLHDPPELDTIKATWDAVADLLPERHGPLQPNISGASYIFRKRFAPFSEIEKLAIQRGLSLMNGSPETERKALDRIAKIERHQLAHDTTNARGNKARLDTRPRKPECHKKNLEQRIFDFFTKIFKGTR